MADDDGVIPWTALASSRSKTEIKPIHRKLFLWKYMTIRLHMVENRSNLTQISTSFCFQDEGALFLNVISKLYKIIHGCTTEEWNRIQPKFLWEKNEEDQNRRLLSSGLYRTDDCDSDSEWMWLRKFRQRKKGNQNVLLIICLVFFRQNILPKFSASVCTFFWLKKLSKCIERKSTM